MTAASQVSLLDLPSRASEDGIMNPVAPPNVDCEMTGSVQLAAVHGKAEERLRRSSYLALQDVSCIASDDVIYLHGCLPSYYLKQVAQEIAAGVDGVRRVINRIEVLRPAARTGAGRKVPAGETV